MSGDKGSHIAHASDDAETPLEAALGPKQVTKLLIGGGKRQLDTCLKAFIPLFGGQFQGSFKRPVSIHGRVGLQTSLSET